MRKLIRIVIALSLVVVLLASATTVFATANTKWNVFQDVSDGGTEYRDTIGTGSYGFVNINQNANGDLRVVGTLKGVAANTTYDVVILAGPTHVDTFARLYEGSTITTNAKGNANTGAIIIPAASLWGSSGSWITGHMDFDNTSTTGTYVATGFQYRVP